MNVKNSSFGKWIEWVKTQEINGMFAIEEKIRSLRIESIETECENFVLSLKKKEKITYRWSTKQTFNCLLEWQIKMKTKGYSFTQRTTKPKRKKKTIQTDYCISLFISNVKNEKILSWRHFSSSLFFVEWMCHIKPTWHKLQRITNVDWNMFIYSADKPWRKRSTNIKTATTRKKNNCDGEHNNIQIDNMNTSLFFVKDKFSRMHEILVLPWLQT